MRVGRSNAARDERRALRRRRKKKEALVPMAEKVRQSRARTHEGKWETTDCTAAEKEREKERSHVADKEMTWPDFH